MSSSMQKLLSSLQPGINDICDVAVGAVPKGGPLWESRKSVAGGWWFVAHHVRVPTVHKKHCHKDSAFLVNQAGRPLGGPYEPLATNH